MGRDEDRSAQETAEEATGRRSSEHEKRVAEHTAERGDRELGEWPRDVGDPPGAARTGDDEERS
jgi:hypothetical protein